MKPDNISKNDTLFCIDYLSVKPYNSLAVETKIINCHQRRLCYYYDIKAITRTLINYNN